MSKFHARSHNGLALHLGPEDGEQQVVRAAFEQVAREGMEQVVDGALGRERQAEPGQAGYLRFEFHGR
ncbi:hypothetical protein [Streptomyces globosus]|uniref:hypothetical protein n=1 Tax=Streptomyces globosus TaxID=68209 RepID=UPI0031D983DF